MSFVYEFLRTNRPKREEQFIRCWDRMQEFHLQWLYIGRAIYPVYLWNGLVESDKMTTKKRRPEHEINTKQKLQHFDGWAGW